MKKRRAFANRPVLKSAERAVLAFAGFANTGFIKAYISYILATLAIAALVLPLCACASAKDAPDAYFAEFDVASYKDIPGVTEQEIEAVEELRRTRTRFHYGMLPSSEAFFLTDGTRAGFSAHFCELMQELFDIPFEQTNYPWSVLDAKLEDKSVDFTGILQRTPENIENYLMSAPIAQRELSVYFHVRHAGRFSSDRALNGAAVGFLEHLQDEAAVRKNYPLLDFTAIKVKTADDAIHMLMRGSIDAFIADDADAMRFASNGLIDSEKILPFVYKPISVATCNEELAPIISVLDKYIAQGGADRLLGLYEKGRKEYVRYKFKTSLFETEREYIDGLIKSGTKIPVAFEADNYPNSFYNTTEGEFQGIALDILESISELSDIEFEVKSTKDSSWNELLGMLRTGEAALVTELLHTDSRKNEFIWALEPYSRSNFAFSSRLEYPDLMVYQIPQVKVGFMRESAYETLYDELFPNSTNAMRYPTQTAVAGALKRGEIDLMFASDNFLLAQTNYYEETGYKANVVFGETIESYFGFNKDQHTLRSIISKAQREIDAPRIERRWETRSFNYQLNLAKERSRSSVAIALVVGVALAVVALISIRNFRQTKTIRRQALSLSSIYDYSSAMICSKDASGRYASCNAVFEKMAGLPAKDIIGKTPREVFSRPEQRSMLEDFCSTDDTVTKYKQIAKIECWCVYPDASRRLLDIMKVPIYDDGKYLGLLTMSHDITELREAAQAAQEASRAKSDFLARMSHELRTPMNAIIGLTELALREKNLEKTLEYAMTVKQAGGNLLAIINDILDISKIEQGKLKITCVPYSLSSLVNDVISIIRMRVIDSQVRFVANVDSALPNALFGDEVRIRQILVNLLNNAVKYTDAGFVELRVSAQVVGVDDGEYEEGEYEEIDGTQECALDDESEDSAGEDAEKPEIRFVFDVIDSGRGIKEQDIELIFGEFDQSDLERNRFIEGTGLGLPIARSIANAMDGELFARSVYGEGSTFTAIIPQKVMNTERIASVERPGEKSVLIYERRSVYADSVIYSVENLGVSCTLVKNETALIKELREREYGFLFIGHALFEEDRNGIIELAGKAKIVLLTEFGESVAVRNLSVLSMPVHCMSIASILNGEYDRFSYSESAERFVGFTAPDARVLLVDDVSTNLKVAEGLLMPYGVQIDQRMSGAAAVEAVRHNRYDLVFMDHKMPDMDGVEATIRIRALKGKDDYYQKVPIIACTANIVSGMKEMFMANGFNGYMAKPIDMGRLNTVLDRWIPKEKQTGSAVVIEDTGADSIDISISGLDVVKGIAFSGGTAELYLSTLAVFYKDGVEKTAQLKKCLADGDFRLYTIYVHAMKSALANIGAARLSDDARELEAAAGNGRDFSSIKHEAFLAELAILLSEINDALNARKSFEQDALDAKAVNLALNELMDAIDSMNPRAMSRIVAKLTELSRHDERVSVAVDEIAEHLLLADYGEAAECVMTLLGEMGEG